MECGLPLQRIKGKTRKKKKEKRKTFELDCGVVLQRKTRDTEAAIAYGFENLSLIEASDGLIFRISHLTKSGTVDPRWSDREEDGD